MTTDAIRNLNPDDPLDRLTQLIDEAQPVAVLLQDQLSDRLPSGMFYALAVDAALDELRGLPLPDSQAPAPAAAPRTAKARKPLATTRAAPAQRSPKTATPVRSVSRKRPPSRESTPSRTTRSR